jgi:meiotically up-regulated gene 157 (Mug157) protein
MNKNNLDYPPHSYPSGIPFARPEKSQRKFHDPVVETVIDKVKSHFMRQRKPEWGLLFENVFPNTLDTTVFYKPGDTFIITGDIPALWLRDSTNQCAPYMPLLSMSNNLKDMIKGLIARQAKCIISDVWANAFKENPSGQISEWAYADVVKPQVSDLVFESKFELDSLAAFLKISRKYIQISGDSSIITSEWKVALRKCIDVMILQQAGTEEVLNDPPYLFQRSSNVPTDTLMLSGLGPPGKRCGLM